MWSGTGTGTGTVTGVVDCEAACAPAHIATQSHAVAVTNALSNDGSASYEKKTHSCW